MNLPEVKVHDAAGYGVFIKQTGKDSFTVRYGLQVKRKMTYAEAAKEMGACIMHALACEGDIENSFAEN